MFDRKMIVSYIAGAFVLAALTRLVPQLSPGSVASYLPSFGGGTDTTA